MTESPCGVAELGLIERPGARLRYRIEGEGTPLLVIGSSTYYPRTFSPRLRAHCRMTFVDLRHFAETDGGQAGRSVTLDDYLADIEALRRELELECFVLVGHSHHGNVALEYGCRFPEFVRGLVLLGSPPCNVEDTLVASEQNWSVRADDERRALLDARRGTLTGDADFVSRYVADAPLYWSDPRYDAGWLWKGVPVNESALDSFRKFFVEYDFSDSAARFKAPVLVITGHEDFVVPPLLWKSHPAPFQAMTWHCLEQCGHTPQIEVADEFDRLLLGWLRAEIGDTYDR